MTDPVQPLASAQAAPPPSCVENPQEVELRYLTRVQNDYRSLDPEGADKEKTKAELTKVFVMLEAVENPSRRVVADVAPVPERATEMGLGERVAARLLGREKPGKPGEPPPKPPPPPVPLKQILKAHNHLVILGEPGTGKSTVLQYIALGFAGEDLVRKDLDLDEDRIPVRVELRAYDPSVRLDEYLVRLISNHPAHVNAAIAWEWLEHGRLAVLLDGLDEVKEAYRDDVAKQIAGFADYPRYQECRIIVTSRIAGYHEIRSSKSGFGHFTICPLTGAENQLKYIAGWLTALEPATTETNQRHRAQALLDRMQGQQSLHRVVSNPLLLRLAVAVYVETGEPPTNRAELYQRYVRDVAWERARKREAPCWSQEQIEAALEAIAWTLQTQGEKTRAELAEPAEVFMARVGQCSEPIAYLQLDLGVLASYGRRQGQALIAFRHLTFQEYFVARRLHRAWVEDSRRAWRFLRPRLHHPAWREPILLLAGMLGQQQATELVWRISKKTRSRYERELRRDFLMGIAIWCELALVQEETAQALAEALARLLLATEIRPRSWLRSLIAIALWLVPILVFVPRASAISAWPSILYTMVWLALWRLSAIGLLPCMRSILVYPERFVLGSQSQCFFLKGRMRILLGMLPTRWAAYVSEILIRALRGSGSMRDLRDFGVLGHLREIGEPALTALTKAVDSENARVRTGAAWALSQLDSWHAEEAENPPTDLGFSETTLSQLDSWHAEEAVNIATAQESGNVNAIEDDQAFLPLFDLKSRIDSRDPAFLTEILTNDPDHFARAEAARLLGEIGAPQTVEFLAQAVQEDEEAIVQQAAIMALGRIGNQTAIDRLMDVLHSHRPRKPSTIKLILELIVPFNIDRDTAPRIRPAGPGPLHSPREMRGIRERGRFWTYETALQGLANIGIPAIAPLMEALAQKDIQTKIGAARALGMIGAPAVEHLEAALRHNDWRVRWAAVLGLGEIGGAAGTAVIGSFYDTNWRVRVAAIFVLRKSGKPIIDEAFQRFIRYPDSKRSGKVQEAREPERILAFLERCLKTPGVAKEAAFLLGLLVPRLSSVSRLRRVGRNLWWRLTDVGDAAYVAYQTLEHTIARITELEVAALGDNPPLFAPETIHRSPFAFLIVLSALVASISGVASNIIASYLQESYQLITNMTRFIIVAAVFIVTLIASILITLRLDRQKS